jgi:hypothetical protein
MDIRLTPKGVIRAKLPVLYLESKLGSPLTLGQLRRYRKHGVDYLIAVTKYSPEVSAKDTLAMGVFTLRWQDIHHRLLHARPPGPRDRFLIESLVAYMEEKGMAYREDLTIKDLETCRRMMIIVASKKDRQYSPRNQNGFELAGACLGLLEDVWHGLVELHPSLASYRHWGPGYFNWTDETNVRWHAFGWQVWKRRQREDNLAFWIWFSEDAKEPLTWTVQRDGTKSVNQYIERSVKRMLKDGRVDQGSLVRWLNSCVKRWKFV